MTAVVVSAGIAVLALVGVPLAARSRAVNRYLDGWMLSFIASVGRRAPAARDAPLPWTSAADLERITRPPDQPLTVTSQPLGRLRMRDPAIVQEVIAFASAIPLDHAESNTARAYVYRHGPLGERPVVLWVPGQYMTEIARVPMSWFIEAILRRGADVVLLVPPYHLERTPAGFSSGDAVLATSVPDHLRVFAQELSDLRRLAVWLRARGVPALGGFGGSLGATILLRTATWDDSFDFLTVFIPAISPGDLLDEPEAAPLVRRFAAEGRPAAEMAALYASLDSTRATPRIDVTRVSALYGRHDRLAGERRILAWAQAWGVTRLFGYSRGHTLSPFTRAMYRDYARLLDEDLRALGQ